MPERFEDREMTGSVFHRVDLKKAVFEDVNLHRATFTNINLGEVVIRDANLTGLTIESAAINSLMIHGLRVDELIEACMRAFLATLTPEILREDTRSVDFGQGTIGGILQGMARHDLTHIRVAEAALQRT